MSPDHIGPSWIAAGWIAPYWIAPCWIAPSWIAPSWIAPSWIAPSWIAPCWIAPCWAFLLLICGVLAIYCEFVWPGYVIPGVCGSVLAIGGTYFLWKNSPTPIGLGLIGAAVILFLAEAFWSVDLVSGAAGVMALACGFCLLFPAPRGISIRLAIPVSAVFGAITVFLLYAAKRARRNKRWGL